MMMIQVVLSPPEGAEVAVGEGLGVWVEEGAGEEKGVPEDGGVSLAEGVGEMEGRAPLGLKVIVPADEPLNTAVSLAVFSPAVWRTLPCT